MYDIEIPCLTGNGIVTCNATMCSICTGSPSGLRVAFAVDNTATTTTSTTTTTTTTTTDEKTSTISTSAKDDTASGAIDSRQHLDQPSSSKHHESLAKRDACSISPTLPLHRVAIVQSTSKSVAQSTSSTSKSGLSKKSALSNCGTNNVNICLLKAPITALTWLSDTHLACGLRDGTVTIVARRPEPSSSRFLGDGLDLGRDLGEWTPTLSRRFHRVQRTREQREMEGDNSRRVVCIRVSGDSDGGGDGAAGGTNGSETTVWVLYGDGVVVCVGLDAISELVREHFQRQSTSSFSRPEGDSIMHGQEQPELSSLAAPSFAKLQLEGQDEILDIVACPAAGGLFETRSDRKTHVILAAGVSPALAFYPVGPETRSFGLASIAWAVASRVTSLYVGAIDGVFGLVGLRGRGRKAAAMAMQAAKGRRGGVGSSDEGDGEEDPPEPLVLRWDGGLQDGWRRVTRLCLDPTGRLAAAADGFGRVILVDCATRHILRMWKGVRDAECGWLEVIESWNGPRVASVEQGLVPGSSAAGPDSGIPSTAVVGLYLAILAPLRGRVELWRMRHGPCVRSIPAPAGSHLLTSRPSVAASGDSAKINGEIDTERLTRCFLVSDGPDPDDPDDPDGCETKLRLAPLMVDDVDLTDLHSRLAREPTSNDAYRLREISTAVAEIRAQGSTGTMARRVNALGERQRLPHEQEAREEALLRLFSELESPESLAQAMASLEGGSTAQPTSPDAASNCLVTIGLSASFQRRVCALSRDRAEEAAAAVAAAAEEAVPTRSKTIKAGERAAIEDGRTGPPASDAKDARTVSEKKGAISALRFRAAAFDLYSLLDSVEVQPAGAAGEDGDEHSAFLPPGKRGWKHAFLCEEAAGWADMVRGASEGMPLLSAELPDMQEFLGTVAVVLELREGNTDDAAKDESKPSLKFIAPNTNGSDTPESSSGRDKARGKGDTSAGSHAVAEHARCRERLLGWMFRPLLSDAFAMASLTQALSLLGLRGKGQAAALVRDMAAWFLALPVGRAADITVGREAQNCPVLRWLKGVILLVASAPSYTDSKPDTWKQERATSALGKVLTDDKAAAAAKGRRAIDLFGEPVEGEDVNSSFGEFDASADSDVDDGVSVEETEGDEETDGDNIDGDVESFQADTEELLKPMYEACAASERLENASMLSVVVAEALTACREKLEESSLGQVAIGGGDTWLALARRLRLCLFLDHRVHWDMEAEQRDRASVRRFQEGRASVYALVAKDQLMSFRDHSLAACARRESIEVEASSRSQREATESKAAGGPTSPIGGAGSDGGAVAVSVAPCLADARMDQYWSMVQSIATRAPNAPTMTLAPGVGPSPSPRQNSQLRDDSRSQAGHDSAKSRSSFPVSDDPLLPKSPIIMSSTDTSPTSLFFMRSHAQSIVLACHRTRWLVLSWAAAGPVSADALRRANGHAAITEAVRAGESAVRRLSLAVDHLSYLRTAKPFLAGCVAYWLWEHRGIRAYVRQLAHDGSLASEGDGNDVAHAETSLLEEGRPAREAFIAAAEEFLKVEALFLESQNSEERGWRGGGGGTSGRKPGSDMSFMSLLTEGAMQRCPWPGAWDRWVEECLRDGQVQTPYRSAVAAHATLLRALRVNTICGLPEGETLSLFEKGHTLCDEGSLRNEGLIAPSSPREPSTVAGEDGLLARREGYIRRALDVIVPRPAQNIYRLVRDFGISQDAARGWHCLVLLRRGHDVLGEEAMSQIFSLPDLASDILTIMRLRLKRFLDFLETSPGASGGLLASLDADTCQWVRSARDFEAEGSAEKRAQSHKEAKEPLRSTHGVLLCLARALPPDSRYKRQANALVTLVGTMLRQMTSGEVVYRR